MLQTLPVSTKSQGLVCRILKSQTVKTGGGEEPPTKHQRAGDSQYIYIIYVYIFISVYIYIYICTDSC